MKFESLLIITYGRSGSTLLQGMLNSIDGYLIRGENEDFCGGLFSAYQSMLKTKSHKQFKPEEPWFNAAEINQQLLLNEFQTSLKNFIIPPDSASQNVRVYGFKEIRYIFYDENFAAYLNFLKMILPNPAFIFNTRNISDVIESQWWRKNPAASRKKLENLEQRFKAYVAQNSNSFHVTYADVCAMNENLEDLFEFLGEDYNKDKIRAVLAKKHSY